MLKANPNGPRRSSRAVWVCFVPPLRRSPSQRAHRVFYRALSGEKSTNCVSPGYNSGACALFQSLFSQPIWKRAQAPPVEPLCEQALSPNLARNFHINRENPCCTTRNCRKQRHECDAETRNHRTRRHNRDQETYNPGTETHKLDQDRGKSYLECSIRENYTSPCDNYASPGAENASPCGGNASPGAENGSPGAECTSPGDEWRCPGDEWRCPCRRWRSPCR